MRCALVAVVVLAFGCTPGPEIKDEGEPFYRLQMLMFQLDERRPEDKPEVERQIGVIANRHIDLMISQLAHGDTERKIAAAFAMGFAHTKRQSLIPILIASMRDGGPEVRRMAAASLGRLRPDPVPAREFRELLYDAHPEPREGALYGLAFVLGPSGDHGLLPDLHARLSDSEALVRNQAVIDLGIVRSPDSIDPLIRHLRAEPSPHVRANIALAFGSINDERANNPLIDMLKDPDPDVVKFADFALRQVNQAELTAQRVELNRNHQVWRDWWEGVQEMRLLRDTDFKQAELAFQYGTIQEAIQVYRKHLSSRHLPVRKAAEEGMQRANTLGMEQYRAAMQKEAAEGVPQLKSIARKFAGTEAGERASKAADDFAKAKSIESGGQ